MTLHPSGRGAVTYADYLALPDDGRRWQVLDGVLVEMTPAPRTTHQAAQHVLAYLIEGWLETHPGTGVVLPAPTDVVLDAYNVVEPDLVFVAAARGAIVLESHIAGAPDLAVEILSPSSVRIDRVLKFALYARHRVPWLWIVDPEAGTIEEFRLAGDAYQLPARHAGAEGFEPGLFPGLVIPLGRVFHLRR